MGSIGFHVTMRLDDGRVLAPGAGARRRAARVFYEQGDARGLVAFRVADTHAHALLVCSREVAGQFALYCETSLRHRLRLERAFETARVRSIEDHVTSTTRSFTSCARSNTTARAPILFTTPATSRTSSARG